MKPMNLSATVAAMLLVQMVLMGAAGAAGAAHGSGTQEVNLFPSQSWASLNQRNVAQPLETESVTQAAATPEQDAAAALAAEAEAQAVLPPMQAMGEWVDGRHRVIVLESQGQTYLLCQRCGIEGAIKPGATVAQQYQFKALEASRAVLLDPQGREHFVDLTPLAQQTS